MHQARGTLERDGARSAPAAAEEERGDAARTVAALLDLVAVAVEDPVEECAVRAPRRFQHQRLIETDAGAAVGERAHPLTREQPARRGRLEDREVVSDSVHLREIDAHRLPRIA